MPQDFEARLVDASEGLVSHSHLAAVCTTLLLGPRVMTGYGMSEEASSDHGMNDGAKSEEGDAESSETKNEEGFTEEGDAESSRHLRSRERSEPCFLPREPNKDAPPLSRRALDHADLLQRRESLLRRYSAMRPGLSKVVLQHAAC